MIISPSRAAMIAAILAGGLPISAQAQTQATAPADDGPIEILVTGQHLQSLTIPNSTGSRLGLSSLDTPASVSVIDGDVLRARGDMSIVEAESRAPGFSSVASPGDGGTGLAARGFTDHASVMQLIDGVRLFPAAGTITFPTDPWMVERIDVLAGPASVLYGQGALGGVVNVLMRKPNTARTEVEGEIGYGPQNTFHVAAGAGGPITDRLSYRVDGSFRRSDGYVDRGQSHSWALSGTLRWEATDTLVITARDDFGDQHPMKYFGTPLIDGQLVTAIRDRNYNVADANIHYRDNRTTLQFDWTPSSAFSLTNQAYRMTSHRSWRDLELYCWLEATGNCRNMEGGTGDPANAGKILRFSNLGIGHDIEQIGDQGSLKYSAPLGSGITNDLVVGFDFNSVKLTYSNDFASDPQESVVDPFTFDPGLFFDTQGVAPRYRTRTTEYAFFAEDRLKLGEHFSVLAGVRTEHDTIKRWNITGTSPDVFQFGKDLHNTTWRVGGIYQPIPTLSLYAQYSTGVDPLGSSITTFSASNLQFKNATGDQVEVGAKASFLGGHGTATLAAYRIVKKNLLFQRTPASPVEQIGQRSSKGIEASVSLELPGGFGIDANGTVLDARFDDFVSGTTNLAGKVPSNVPETSANLWLRWNATHEWQGRVGLRYVGQTFADDANQFRVPAYAVVDATISYAITPRIAVDVHAYNLLDKDYAVTTYDYQQWILGRPRSFDVTLRAGF